jgi:hypothetical protein
MREPVEADVSEHAPRDAVDFAYGSDSDMEDDPFASIEGFDSAAPVADHGVNLVPRTLSLCAYKLYDWMLTTKSALSATRGVWDFFNG